MYNWVAINCTGTTKKNTHCNRIVGWINIQEGLTVLFYCRDCGNITRVVCDESGLVEAFPYKNKRIETQNISTVTK